MIMIIYLNGTRGIELLHDLGLAFRQTLVKIGHTKAYSLFQSLQRQQQQQQQQQQLRLLGQRPCTVAPGLLQNETSWLGWSSSRSKYKQKSVFSGMVG